MIRTPYPGKPGPSDAEEFHRIGSGSRLCRRSIAEEDGSGAGAAKVATRRQPAPNAGPRHPPRTCLSPARIGSRRRPRAAATFDEQPVKIAALGSS